jgi:23S rRNA (pseudouridine1915-N3)-methyltransferase
MKLQVLWIGKTKDSRLAQLCSDYISRIEHFLPLSIVELKDPKAGIEAEADRILASIDASDRVVVLDPRGRPWTSEQVASFIEKHMSSDPRTLTFVIGGHSGLADRIKERADIQWSLSSLTFTHDLTRVLLLEQLYRALTIIRNIPYSK